MIPATRPSGTGPVGAQRFERYLLIVVSVFAVSYALQTVTVFTIDLPSLGGPLSTLVVTSIWASALGAPVALLSRRFRRTILTVAVAGYGTGLAALPFALIHPLPQHDFPWFAAVSAAPLASLAVASSSTVFSMAVGVALAADLGFVLATVGGLLPVAAAVDALLVVMFSVVLSLLVAALRSGVRRADVAQASLLEIFGADRAEAATEVERRRTDALLHDAVLTTFLSTAAARTPEDVELAGRMAANAVRVLAHVNRSAAYGSPIPFAEAWADVSQRLVSITSRFAVQDSGSGSVVLPAAIADAMLEAMAEAMTNSVRHAEAEHREVRITPLGPDGLRIVVHDDGVGFDPAAVTMRGIPTLMQAPLHRFHGRADVESAPGRGCTVVLSWGSIVITGTDPLLDDSLVRS